MAIIVLAGGQSRRMGQDKALLPLAGRPMLAWVIRRLGAAGLPVLVVTRPGREQELQEHILLWLEADRPQTAVPAGGVGVAVRVVADRFSGRGPLGGIHAGLEAAGDGFHLVAACDQPLLTGQLARFLLERAWQSQRAGQGIVDAVVVRSGGRVEVLPAVLHHRCAQTAERLLARTVRPSLRDLLGALRQVCVEAWELEPMGKPELLLWNVNRPEDVAVALRHLGDTRPGHS